MWTRRNAWLKDVPVEVRQQLESEMLNDHDYDDDFVPPLPPPLFIPLSEPLVSETAGIIPTSKPIIPTRIVTRNPAITSTSTVTRNPAITSIIAYGHEVLATSCAVGRTMPIPPLLSTAES